MIRIWKFLLLGSVIIASCSPTRSIPEGDALYTGARVTLNADSVTQRQKKVLRSDLQAMTRPKPNTRFLGIPFKLMIWNMLKAKKETSFMGKMRSRFGEPPVLASQVNLDLNTQILTNYLDNKGFFTAKVTGDSTWKRKRASAQYTANAGDQYNIASVTFSGDSSDLSRTIRETLPASLLQVGQPYDLDLIKGERLRIDAYLKERGFYYFSPDFLMVQADSTAGWHQVALRMIVKPETPVAARTIYYINDVYIYGNYSLNTARTDTIKANSTLHAGYNIIDAENRFNPSLFERMMQFNRDEVYNRTDHNKTLNRLINLNTFKFVKNRFERADVDSPKLDVYYYLTPFPNKSIRAEIGANTRSNNQNGSNLTFGFHHRNLFRAAEQFDLKLYTGTGVQFAGSFEGTPTYRLGGEINFSIPRFIAPFKWNPKSAYVPRTNMQLGYEILNRKSFYTIHSFRSALGYTWRPVTHISHEFFPISVTYTLPLNVSPSFKRDTIANPTLKHIIDTQFILGGTYQYTLNQPASGIQKRNSFYFNGLLDGSGNLTGLFVRAEDNNRERIFNLPFSQYLKFEVDGRYYRQLGLGSSWANRIVFGYSFPYGNSRQLPYIKQFFTGGNNSIRAFRSRTVGPGTYLAVPLGSGHIPDQTGDIKVELNTEYRPKISGPLYGAVFIDAGNIWLKHDDPFKPGAKFSSKFLSELAVGGGIGIRLDIQVFVIRFDVAVPLRKPWLSPGQRWVTGQMFDKGWLGDNMVFNLAIGYPF